MKKLLLSLGTIAVGLTPIVAIVSCGEKDEEAIDKKQYEAIAKIPISDSREITTTTNYKISGELTDAQMKNAELKTAAEKKATNEIKKDEIKEITVSGFTYTIEWVVPDGILNTVLNVRIEVKEGSKVLGKYVSSIPKLKAPDPYDYQKGVIITSVVEAHNPRWIRANKYLGKRAKNNGYYWTGSHENLAEDQKNAVTTHVSEAKSESRKIKGLTLGAKDSGAGGMVGTLGKASGEEFPIVAYDRLIKAAETNYDWYTSFDGYAVGRYQGLAIAAHLVGHDKPFKDVEEMKKYVADHKDDIEEGTFLILVGSATDNNTTLFYNGEMDVLKELEEITKDGDKEGKIRLVGPRGFNENAIPDWVADHVDEKLRTNYNNLNDKDKKLLKAIVSPNDSFGLAAQSTLKSLGVDVKKIYITGQDANPGAVVSIAKEHGGDMTLAKPDRLLSAINIGVIEGLQEYDKKDPLSKGKWKDLKAGEDKDAAADWVVEFVKTKNPTIPFIFVKDKAQYFAGKGNEKKVIYSVLIDPILITKANYEEFFEVKEKK